MPRAYTAHMNSLQRDIRTLVAFLHDCPRLVVLTGAGISADSGIPTYRDSDGRWLHSVPIRHHEFIASAATRRRYWARSWHGWPVIRDARPNMAHRALATLERAGYIELLVTQNVDRLHQRAGSRAVVDLHGRLDTVRCLACGHCVHRDSVQAQLAAGNQWTAGNGGSVRPDGDHDISDDNLTDVVLPRCDACAGDLKPDVVFFGGNIPAERLQACATALERADGLLAVGSSRQVISGFRLCRSMHRAGKPVLIINPGITRADDLACAHLRSPAAALLSGAADALRLTLPACAGDNPS